jgi:hypothetical protein
MRDIYRRNFPSSKKCDVTHDIGFFPGSYSSLIIIRRLLWILSRILGQTDSTRHKNGNGAQYPE